MTEEGFRLLMAFGFRVLRQGSRRSKIGRGTVALVAVLTPLLAVQSAGQAAPTLTIAQVEAKLSVLQTQQDQAVEAFNQGQIALTAAQRAAKTTQTSVDRQEKKVAAAEAQLSGLARVAYMTGGIDPVTGLLSGQGSASVIDRVGNLDQIARVRSAQMIALQAQQTILSGLEITNKQRLATATSAAATLDASRKNVQQLINAQNAVLGGLQADARKQLQIQQASARAAAQRQAVVEAATVVQQASTPSGGSSGSPVPPSSSGMVSVVLAAAYSQLGKPYRYAGSGPNSYDCSGLTMWAFAHAGISLPHSSQAQYNIGQRVSRDQLQPGDLVFFDEGGTIGHVGIYVGNGNMIDANHTGGWVGVRGLYDGFAGGSRL